MGSELYSTLFNTPIPQGRGYNDPGGRIRKWRPEGLLSDVSRTPTWVGKMWGF